MFPLLCPDSTLIIPVNSQLTGIPKAASHREIVMELKLALGQRPGERITATNIKHLDTSVTHRDVHTFVPHLIPRLGELLSGCCTSGRSDGVGGTARVGGSMCDVELQNRTLSTTRY